jgi:histidinol phosphatase-like enzyme
VREPTKAERRALIMDFDDLVGSAAPVLRAQNVSVDAKRANMLATHRKDGWLLFVHAWRPQVERNEATLQDIDACFARLRELIGDVDIAICPHDAGPPVCWCRKPIPGSVIEFASRRSVALDRSIVVGASAADRTMAERIEAPFQPSESFFRA